MFRAAVNPSLGRTHAFGGWPRMVTQGLRGAGSVAAMLRANLSALLLSCCAQKAGDLPSWQVPLDMYVSPLVRTPRHLTSRAHLEIRRDALNQPCFARSAL